MSVEKAITPAEAVKVKAESTQVVGEELNRRKIIMNNLSETLIYLSYGGEATKEKGFVLVPEGPPFVEEEYKGAIAAVVAEGEGTLGYTVV